jgi:hypothetical protein
MKSSRWANLRLSRARRAAALAAALAALIAASLLARAAAAPAASTTATFTLINKAPIDECFAGIGVPYPPGPPCPSGSTPKVNGAYVWSMVEPPGAVWYGTAPNMTCLGQAELSNTVPTPSVSADRVCEFGSSTYKSSCLPRYRDQRPPRILRYDITAGTTTDKTPLGDSRLKSALGIRLSARNGGVLLFGGPDCAKLAVDFFAFDESTGAYIGSAQVSGYTDVRRGATINGILYIGAKQTFGPGAILRWTGNLRRPFQFQQVGVFDAEAGEVSEYQGRIVVGTWPTLNNNSSGPRAGIWMSPAIPAGGLTSSNANQWTKVWSVDAYEPDPLTASTYLIGKMSSFGSYLYFGTMHRQDEASETHEAVYGPDTTGTRGDRTRRATMIFRAQNLGAGNQQVQVLYGEQQLWVESPANTWTLTNNNLNQIPLFGSQGFGNIRNRYDWSMAVFNNKLYVGTLDTGSGGGGADVWAFPDTSSPATAITLDGFGNSENSGIRVMLADDNGIWVGTANPSNLRTNPANPPLGGWEFGRLTP